MKTFFFSFQHTIYVVLTYIVCYINNKEIKEVFILSKNAVPVVLPDKVKEKLIQMSDETKISQASLIRMAVESLVVNYDIKGSFIFADLLNPDYKAK